LQVFVVAQERGGLSGEQQPSRNTVRLAFGQIEAALTVGLPLPASTARHIAQSKSIPWQQCGPCFFGSTTECAQLYLSQTRRPAILPVRCI
jgi:hypothetical protein